MIDRVLDGLLPTRRQPAPALGTAADWRVLADRVVATLLDLVICFLFLEAPVVYLLGELFPAQYQDLGGFIIVTTLVALLPIYVTYAFVFEWRYGRTPGKVNRRLLVVMADGSQCTLRGSAVRNLARYVDLLGVPPLVLGVVVMLSSDGRRIGDHLAGTVVVRSTVPADHEGVMRPTLERDARSRGEER